MIEIVEGVWLDPWAVTLIKKLEDGKCALWTTGQSALDGFVLDYEASEVAEEIIKAKAEYDDSENDDDTLE